MIPLLCLLLLQSPEIKRAVELAANSGRVLLIGDTDAERLGRVTSIPPGLPPVLAFRYLEGVRRRRFADSDLVIDDAGH